MILNSLLSPEPNKQPLVKRTHQCSFCSADEGHLLSQVDYWDISFSNLVKCPRCSLTQLDPMPTDEMMDLGCNAFYRMQHTHDNPKSIQRGFLRAFRKGVAFGVKLKLSGIKPTCVLEIGSGDGYFSRGIQFVFPEAKFTCLDLVEDLLKHIKKHHGFETIKGSPETINENSGPFDLVIARDIIEHLADPGMAFKKLARVISPGGYFHFITPNGPEDYWGHFSHWKLTNKPTELLLNHVNYFDAQGLKKKLLESGFTPVMWFNYDFSGAMQGYGRKITPKLTARTSTKRSAKDTLQASTELTQSFSEIIPAQVLNIWWLKLPRFLVLTYCYFKQNNFIRLNADYGIGHEIFCVARKK